MRAFILFRLRLLELKPARGLFAVLLAALLIFSLGAALPASANQPHSGVFVVTWQSACAAPPSGAVTALEAAAALWAARMLTPLDIHVSACWTSTPPCTGLACGRTAGYLFNTLNAPQVDSAYPLALANALAGSDLNGSQHELAIWFDADESWSFTVDPPGSFLIAALHELGHGLGFESGFYESYNVGFCADGPSGYLYPCPTIFDRAVVDGSGVPLLSYKLPDPRVLGSKLKSDARFGGPNTRLSNGGAAVQLYTPAVFDQGSSISHLALSYTGGADGLMTPSAGVASGSPPIGPLTVQIFRDLGWQLAGGAPNLTTSGPAALGLDQPFAFQAQLAWSAYSGQPVTYTWSVDGQPGIQHTVADLTDALTLSWSASGLHALILTASGPFGQVSTTRSLLVFDLHLSGPASCAPGASCTYTAGLLPGATYLPVSYHWQASDQSDVLHPDIGTSDSLVYTWSTPGIKTIILTATIAGQPIQVMYTVTVSGAALPLKLFLPLVIG